MHVCFCSYTECVFGKQEPSPVDDDVVELASQGIHELGSNYNSMFNITVGHFHCTYVGIIILNVVIAKNKAEESSWRAKPDGNCNRNT
jgi:hypothetical protein